jgi:hypothetical protein
VKDYEENARVIEESIRKGLESFLGEKNDYNVRNNIQIALQNILCAYCPLEVCETPVPVVKIDGSIITVKFLDTTTGDEVDLLKLLRSGTK